MFSSQLTINDISQYLTKLTAKVYYIKQKIDLDYKWLDLDNNLPYTFQSFDEGHTIGGEIQVDFSLGSHYLTLGLDFDRAYARSVLWNVGGVYSWFGMQPEDRKGYSQTMALFAQDEWKLSPFVTMTLGLRYTSSENKVSHHQVFPDRVNGTKDDNIVGSLGLVYYDNEGLTLRALVSQGFRSPTLSDQLMGGPYQMSIPNPNLKPEKSLNFELGARYSNNNLTVDAALFYSSLDDAYYEKVTDIPNPIGFMTQVQNSDKATSYGAEILVEYFIENLGLTPYLSMTAMRYVRKYDNGYKTDNTGVPKTWGNGGFRWERNLSDNLRIFTDASLTWSAGYHDEGPNGITDSTKFKNSGTRVDFVIGLEGGENHKFKATLNFRNIGDQKYEPNWYFQPGFHVVGTIGYEY
jgi:hemoglobin/transferrin/lactoferrin receptor protein